MDATTTTDGIAGEDLIMGITGIAVVLLGLCTIMLPFVVIAIHSTLRRMEARLGEMLLELRKANVQHRLPQRQAQSP